MANNKVQDYGEMATTFQRVVNVVDHFESYNHIEQVAELTSRVKKIKSELSIRAKREFEEMFTNPFAKVRERNRRLVESWPFLVNLNGLVFQFNPQLGSDLCKMIDVLDAKMKNELIKVFLKQQLNEYGVLFEESQEVSPHMKAVMPAAFA